MATSSSHHRHSCHSPPQSAAIISSPPTSVGVWERHEMVGLSVILESCEESYAKKSPQVINKGNVIKPPSNPSSPTSPSSLFGFSWGRSVSNPSLSSGFLDHCYLCKQKLLPSKDIYMYKGDRAFCSVECRCRQIFMDEEETSAKTSSTKDYNCSLAAMKQVHQVTTTGSPSSSRCGNSKGGRISRANGAFA